MEIHSPLPMEVFVFASVPAWLYSAVAVLFFSFLNGATSNLLYFTFQEGQLLHPYRQWLERNLRFAGGMRSFWYKPLCGCIICMNVWLAMLSFGLVVAGIGIEPAGWCLPFWGIGYVVVSNAWLRVLLIKN
jgi:hypothetical protein